jgi:hypothetical protein
MEQNKQRIIVGLVGFIGSGKDTVAKLLQDEHGYERHSFAASVKDSLSVIFGWDRTLLEGLTPESRQWRERDDPWWAHKLGIKNFTPRYAMQHFATNICRNHFHKDLWVASLERKITKSSSNLVISDCRFANEIAMLKQHGARIIWVNRDPLPTWYAELCAALFYPPDSAQRNNEIHRLGIHHSEVEWVDMEHDHVIYNSGSLSDLNVKVRNLVESLQLAI